MCSDPGLYSRPGFYSSIYGISLLRERKQPVMVAWVYRVCVAGACWVWELVYVSQCLVHVHSHNAYIQALSFQCQRPSYCSTEHLFLQLCRFETCTSVLTQCCSTDAQFTDETRLSCLVLSAFQLVTDESHTLPLSPPPPKKGGWETRILLKGFFVFKLSRRLKCLYCPWYPHRVAQNAILCMCLRITLHVNRKRIKLCAFSLP